MNESVFRELLGESLKREYAEFDKVPEHKFSLKHRRAMKRIFIKYERNKRNLQSVQGVSLPRTPPQAAYRHCRDNSGHYGISCGLGMDMYESVSDRPQYPGGLHRKQICHIQTEAAAFSGGDRRGKPRSHA